MKLRFLLQLVGALLLWTAAAGSLYGQGSTTSSMNGRITDDAGEPLIGANVLAVHQPSGTTYGNSTDVKGFFRIPNMRVGGPYTVTVSYTGYEEAKYEEIYLELGQAFRLNAELSETAMELQGVEVVATRSEIFDGNRTGQETVISEEEINSLPTTTRSIADFARANPLVSINEGGDGFNISIAGQNNRYNAIYIDGAVNNDVFGLAGSGTNGGQTGAQPISIDAVEQFQVSVAPFDVRLGGFAGGAISAVTRSGTNEFEGSAYWFYRNQNLVGLDPERPTYDEWQEDLAANDPNADASRGNYRDEYRLDDFTAQTAGFRLGGPIVKNKLFFFVNAEFQRDRTPQPYTTFEETYRGDSDRNDINRLINKVENEFGYDMGTFENNQATLDRNFVLAKLDFALSQNHKLTLRHSWTDIENFESRQSNPGRINFENGAEFFPSVTHSSAFEWSGVFGNNLSNKLVVGYTRVRDDRDVFGPDFPTVRIQDGSARMEFGAERFSTANRLDQDVVTLTNDFQIFSGRHTITIGTHNEFYSVANLFIRENFGYYQYDSLDQFLNDLPATQYSHSFSQVDNVVGDESEAIASFTGFQLGLYIQDEFNLSDNFKLTAGIRLDVPIFPDPVPTNQVFNDSIIPLVTQALTQNGGNYTLPDGTVINYFGDDPFQGARTGQFIDAQFLIAPRVGFNWDIFGNRSTQLRGGAGIFNSRIPLVWPGGAYNNYGLNISNTRLFDQVIFEPDVNNQTVGLDENGNEIKDVDVDNPVPGGQIDLFAKDLKVPQIFRANLAIDQKLPIWGLVASVDLLYTKTLNALYYQNLALPLPTENLEGTPDNRPRFDARNQLADPPYNGIYLGQNTSKGYTWNAAVTISKPTSNGFGGSFSYSFGDTRTAFDGTSSQNNSQWRGIQNPLGLNAPRDPDRSAFAPLHRVILNGSYRFEYLNHFGTQISFFYNGQTGDVFGWTYNSRSTGSNSLTNQGNFSNNDLIYVPNDQSEINLVPTTVDGQTFTPDQQWEILNQYIEDNPSLGDFRGEYVTRNTGNFPFTSTLDVRLLQDFFIETKNGKRNTLQLSLDIFNFTNMIGNLFGNQRWGRIYGSTFNYTIMNFEGFQQGTRVPEFTVDDQILRGEDPWTNRFVSDASIRSTRWSMQIGLRYIFE